MKFKVLRHYSFHTLLVAPFIVLFLFVHNLRQVSHDMVWRSFAFGMIGTVLLFGLFYLLFRNRLKTGVFVTFLTFGLFQYGTLYDFLEQLYYAGHWPFSNIHRYLVVLYLLVILTLFLVIFFSKHNLEGVNFFLNVLLLLLLFFNVVQLGTRFDATGQETAVDTASSGIVFDSTADRPDVYYIVLDGYAANRVLRKYYNFDNGAFTRRLTGLGFQVSDSAFANHYYTSYSLGATLNMDLSIEALQVNKKIENNLVMKCFSENGYRIYHLSSGYAVTGTFASADSCVTISGPNEFEKILLRHTILRLDDLFGFFSRQRLSSQFAQLKQMANISSSTPKFCFIHIVAPHPPYVFDRNGQLRTRRQFSEHSWEPKEHYTEQMEYVNKQVGDFIETVRTKNPGAVIVLQSDHGPWITAGSADSVFEARSGILYAQYGPASLTIPEKTSPVNTYRYLFNCLYNTHLSILPDSLVGKKALMNDPILVKKVRAAL